MTERTVRHTKLTIERTYPVPRQRVFKAFSDAKSKAKWFVGPADWDKSDYQLDFREGGKESVSGGPVHHFSCTY